MAETSLQRKSGWGLTAGQSTALAALVAAVVLLPLAGRRPLTDWDEGIYAEVAREMLSLGWGVPHFNGQVWLEKPPLAMWMTAVLYKVFGVSAWTARAVSAGAGVGTVALLHGWLARVRGQMEAWLATGMLLATFGFLHACHTGELDTLLALWCVVSVVGLAEGSWIFFWVGFGLAAMTKGAASVVLAMTLVGVVALRPRGLKWGKEFWIGLGLFAAMVLPWHVAMFARFGQGFVGEYLSFHVLERATQQIEGHRTGWWFYLKVLLVSAPPFCLVYPVAVGRAMREDARLRVMAVFALVVLVFWSVVQTRLPQYIVPAWPALTAVAAVYLAAEVRGLLTARRSAGQWVQMGMAVVTVFAVTMLATGPARSGLHSAVAGEAAVEGGVLLENRESVAVLRETRERTRGIGGPLLLWRAGRVSSIATDVFYAERRVEQVEVGAGSEMERDRYRWNPVRLEDAVGAEPRVILLDRGLVRELPVGYVYTAIAAQGSVELGTIVRER